MTTTTKTPNTRNLAIIVSLTAATVGVVYGYDTGSIAGTGSTTVRAGTASWRWGNTEAGGSGADGSSGDSIEGSAESGLGEVLIGSGGAGGIGFRSGSPAAGSVTGRSSPLACAPAAPRTNS